MWAGGIPSGLPQSDTKTQYNLKRVLIISPHFPPINAPDHQRVRMALPLFKEFGWEPIVLAVSPAKVEGVLDPTLAQTLPEDLRVVWSGAWSARWTRRFGVGSLAYRAGRYLKRAGENLLRRERFDLVFFSTTVFPTLAFGPLWRKKFGIPYILDFQDPWLSDYYLNHPKQRPPGGRLKYGFAQWLARRLEPAAVRGAAHIVCVSPEYPRMFQHRYPELRDDQFTTLPFSASESDYEFLRAHPVRQTIFNPQDGRRHWVYAGVCNPGMELAARAFFAALNELFKKQPVLRKELQIHFVGTSYALNARKIIEPVARECGVGDVVSEQTDRLPYFAALRCLSDADALIILGSNDPGYTASKVFPYILAQKPLLAVFHEASSVVGLLKLTKAGTVVTFRNGESVEMTASRITATGWLNQPAAPATDWLQFKPYSVREMTRRLSEVFDKCTPQKGRKVLIVSPHFPPINAPDHQRVRMALPFLKDFGWEPVVLAVNPAQVEGLLDPMLAETLPSGLRVVWSEALPVRWTRKASVGSLAYRAGFYLNRAGEKLLRQERFDLIFFSTTVFPTMALGPRWRKKFGVPYILDFQDPWLSDYYTNHAEQRPPGGRLKYGFAHWRAGQLEPPAVRGAAHIVCVSPDYPRMLQRRYADLREDQFTTLPFGAAESDFESLPKLGVKNSLFDPQDGRQHWVYIGRGGADMAFSIRAFFQALKRFFDACPDRRANLRIHFAGTDYAPTALARKTIKPAAHECGVGNVVSERTDRLPYFETLRCLCDADALIIPGSDDPGYTASKIYPYILARKPLLAIFNEQSSVVEVLRKTRGGTVVPFKSDESCEAVTARILESGWLQTQLSVVKGQQSVVTAPATDWSAFAPYSAREMTRKLCEVFDQALKARDESKM